MSKVVDIKTALGTLIEATISGYTQLADAYQADDNSSLDLLKGYSIGFGPSENVQDEWCMGEVHQRRQFQVTLTNGYWPDLDADKREDMECDLMNDEFDVISAIQSDITLTGVSISSAFISDNGIEYLIGDQKQFIIIEMTVLVDYIEGVT